MKVALYARVSTEDQARGLSIDTQLDNLRAWAKAQGHVIVKEYVDPGVSARKPPVKRPALQQLLSELDGIELIAFTRLDRWTRNIKGYYDVQAILDAHKVAWAAILEDYETASSAGRFRVNIMLSINEAESDRTGERIKTVLDRKVANGEYIGNRVPYGYSVEGKHLVQNDKADDVRAAFELYRRTGSIYQVKEFLHDRGHKIVYVTVCRILRNPMYAGRYRDNLNYCEPIVSQEVFDEVQQMLEQRSYRQNKSKRVYLFSGMIRCACCGKILVGSWSERTHDKYRYRCNYRYLNGRCPNGLHLREGVVEQFLLDNVATELERITAAVETKPKKKSGPTKASIVAKIERLQELYVDGMIDKAKFTADREKLLAQLPKEEPQHDFSAARQIVLAGDFRERYNELTREEKRALWRSLVDHVTADEHGNLQLYFYP